MTELEKVMKETKGMIEEFYGGPPTEEQLADLIVQLYRRFFSDQGYADPDMEVYKLIKEWKEEREKEK